MNPYTHIYNHTHTHIYTFTCAFSSIQVGSKFFLVFPLCTGGELYEHIVKRGTFTERYGQSHIYLTHTHTYTHAFVCLHIFT
ncbi:hypothetical protein EON63_24780 [archaeon]|nr:MAG: hypothetical protein EON63_24780 [archaeon]